MLMLNHFRKYLSIFVVFIFISTVHGQLQKLYYENGNVKAEGFLLDSLKHDRWKYFYPNGQINAIEYYDKGDLNGKSIFGFKNMNNKNSEVKLEEYKNRNIEDIY